MPRHTSFKGKQITEEEALEAMARFDETMRAGYPSKRWKTYAIEHSGKLYPPKDTMRLIVGYDDIGPGGAPVNRRFEDLGFRIVTIGGPPETEEEEEGLDAIEASFSLERDMEQYLLASLGHLEPGLKPFTGDPSTSRQYDTKVVGIIDVLAVDSANAVVVIELKAGEAGDRVCGQIQRYMGWAKETVAGPRQVRGIIVANSFSDSLRYAVRVVPAISLTKYSVSFKFENATPGGA